MIEILAIEETGKKKVRVVMAERGQGEEGECHGEKR